MPDDLGDEALFEVDPGQRVGSPAARVKGPVDKTFRVFDPAQGLLLPPSLDDWLPTDHLARFVAELVDEHLDLDRIYAEYDEKRGAPPYDPRLMVRILLFGYTTGVRSSRKLEAACTDVVAFRWLAAGAGPDYRAIARFRRRHLSALGHLFTQALALCQAAGMVRLGRVALDGTKVRANASRRKAMSYARMSEKEKILAAEVSDLLAAAERIDKDEDAKFGKDNRGDELPAELARRETRLARIQAAKAALEAEAQAAAGAAAEQRCTERGDDPDTTAAQVGQAKAAAVPKPKAQRNFTDPDSKIMKTSDGSFHQCFNAQAVVDEAHQVIIATELGQCAADVGTLIAMSEQVLASTGAAPGELLADAGYCSADNLQQAAEFTAAHGTEFFIATGRTKRDDPIPAQPRGRIPKRGWPASSPPRPGGLPTPAEKPSWNRCSVRCTPSRTASTCCYAALRAPAGNGCCWPPATTSASSTPRSESRAWEAWRPAERGGRWPFPAHQNRFRPRSTALPASHAHEPESPGTERQDPKRADSTLPTHAPRRCHGVTNVARVRSDATHPTGVAPRDGGAAHGCNRPGPLACRERGLQDLWSVERVFPDADGDCCYGSGTAACFIGLDAAEPVVVKAVACAAVEVKRTAKLLEELNEVNARCQTAHVYSSKGR